MNIYLVSNDDRHPIFLLQVDNLTTFIENFAKLKGWSEFEVYENTVKYKPNRVSRFYRMFFQLVKFPETPETGVWWI